MIFQCLLIFCFLSQSHFVFGTKVSVGYAFKCSYTVGTADGTVAKVSLWEKDFLLNPDDLIVEKDKDTYKNDPPEAEYTNIFGVAGDFDAFTDTFEFYLFVEHNCTALGQRDTGSFDLDFPYRQNSEAVENNATCQVGAELCHFTKLIELGP